MILHNLLRRPTRSLLTMLGIAIGVATVVALGAMANGMAKNYGSALGLSNDLLVTQANSYDVVMSSLDEVLGDRIRALPDVRNVDPGIFTWIAFDESPYFLIYGYPSDSVAMQHYRVVEGKPVTMSGQVVIGRRGADALKKTVGDTLRMNGQPFRIVGIYETGQGMEESGGVITLSDAQTIAQKERKVSLFQVGLRPNANIDKTMARIKSLDKALTVTEASNYNASQQWTDYLNGFAWGISAIAILIGGLGMMSAMVMSVLERTREIGTLRAVGWSRGRVLRLILGESLALSLIGGVGGVLLGIFLAWLAGKAPGVGAFLEGAVEPGILVQGLLTALALGLVGGAYPAWTAANLQPVEALRYEGGGTGGSTGWLTRVGSQSFRNLWRRRNRTLLSALGIGVGVGTLVMLGGLTDGMVSQLNGLAGSGGAGNITVMQRDIADMSLSSVDERVVDLIQALPEVKAVSPFMLGIISSPDMPMFLFGGLDPTSPAMRHYRIVEGRSIQRPNEMILGKVAADNYKVKVGDTLSLNNNRYKIVGITQTGVAYEDAGGMLALREAQRLMGRPRAVTFIFVDVKDSAQTQQMVDLINKRFPEARASLSSEFAQNTNDLQMTMGMAAAIRYLALIVGGIVVANTMIMSIFERTREIGTLRALGWRRRRILGQILLESLLLCMVAAILGSAIGVGLMTLLTRIPNFGSYLSATWNTGIFVSAFVTAGVLAILGGLYPAWRASKLEPAEALRYE